MNKNKIELIGCTVVGCIGLGLAFTGIANGQELAVNIGSAMSTLFPLLGVFRFFS